ncbi:MAG: MBL fold metallo-hydrolase [Butyrivibrio sp.]|nr:MBL fold metallo-hydrolase [Butyrivibrio sp.]
MNDVVVHELKYSNTNTYLIKGSRGIMLFDTGWAGSFSAFCSAIGKLDIPVQKIDYILISHFHPDHMGIAQEIAEYGPVIVVMDVQREYIHTADGVFEKEKNDAFIPIVDDNVKCIRIEESRDFLGTIGINGEIIPTPGHSDDSISLWIDSGELFVGDLNPLYELDFHKGMKIEKSWNRLLKLKPETVYYGHAKTANVSMEKVPPRATDDLYKLVSMVIKNIDRGVNLDKIQKKTGADSTFIEDVARMYLTHQNVGVQGILDRIEIKGR